MIIEDEMVLREAIIESLKILDFEVIAAENGRIGVQLAHQHKPDLVLCDIMMPEVDGYGVFTTLRQLSETAKIPFIFISAKGDKSDIRQGMNLGAEDYLTKPFTIDELSQAISTQLEKREIINQESQSKLDELRSNITRTLPHELRTPLQGILGFSEILVEKDEMILADKRQKMLWEINNSAQRLSRLIQNFLLYAEIEIMTFDAEQVKELQSSKTYAPNSIITDVAIYKARQAAREADLQVNLQDTIINISERHLQKIAEELIDNALKFSPVSTPIHIESTLSDKTFIFSVLNQGQGMTTEQIASLGAYMQFEREIYEQQGSGLGLTIAKRLAELHGGALTIESIPNKQIKVEIALPISIDQKHA